MTLLDVAVWLKTVMGEQITWVCEKKWDGTKESKGRRDCKNFFNRVRFVFGVTNCFWSPNFLILILSKEAVLNKHV